MSSKAEIESFDTEQLCEFLQQKHKLCDKTIESVRSNLEVPLGERKKMDGRALFEVPLGERKTIQRIFTANKRGLDQQCNYEISSCRDL